MKILTAFLILLSALLLGCANTIPADPAKMSPEQLREVAKDKNANISCGVVNSPYGRGVMTYVVLDKTVVIDGSVSVDNECKVMITSNPKAPAPAASR